MNFKGEKYRKFFTKSAEQLAPWLLGKIICHRIHDERGDFTICGRITVTEAYSRSTGQLSDLCAMFQYSY